MDEKEQQEAYLKSWRKIIGTPWLWPTHYDIPISMVAYMEMWEYRTGGDFFAFRGPVSYKPELLEKFKDKIIQTNQVFADDGRSWIDTIVQVDSNTHMLINWNWSIDETSHKLSVGLYVKDPATYAKFLKEYQSYEFKETTKAPGFGTPSGHLSGY